MSKAIAHAAASDGLEAESVMVWSSMNIRGIQSADHDTSQVAKCVHVEPDRNIQINGKS